MPGTITDDIEIIDAGHGGGTDVPAGGDDDGEGSGSGLPAIPQRAYFTAIQLALAGIVMFFMALTSSFLVRKGLGNDWVSFALAAHSLGEYAGSAGQQRDHPDCARASLREGSTAAFRRWWGITTALGVAVSGRANCSPGGNSRAQGVFLVTNPSSSFFYVLTALHGLHLAGRHRGACCTCRSATGSARESRKPPPRIVASIYWHFMDGLWVFLLALLYLGR